MKKILTWTLIGSLGIVLCSFSNSKKGPAAIFSNSGKDSLKQDVAEKQENDFLREKKGDALAYEFTKAGDYRFIVTEVQTPIFDFLNLCLDGPAAGLHFEDRRIICPEVKNDFRCITGLHENLASNEYVVHGIKAGALLRVWPSNPSVVIKTSGIHCTSNKFNCNLYGPQAEWGIEGYKMKVMVMRLRQ